MRPRKKVHRNCQLKILLTAEELATFKNSYKTTSFRTISSYSRALLLGQPIIIFYRCQSLDQFLPAAAGIRDHLDVISRNWNRILKILQTLPETGDLRQTLALLLSEEFTLRQDIREIKSLLLKIYDHVRETQHSGRDE